MSSSSSRNGGAHAGGDAKRARGGSSSSSSARDTAAAAGASSTGGAATPAEWNAGFSAEFVAKAGLAQMLKRGVIMDVVNGERGGRGTARKGTHGSRAQWSRPRSRSARARSR